MSSAYTLLYCYYIVHSLVTCFLLPQLIFTPYQPFFLTHPAYGSNCDFGLLTISELIVDIFVMGKEDNIWDLISFCPSANCMLLLVSIAEHFVCSSLPCIFLFPPYHCTSLLSLLEALNNMHN